MRQNKAMNIVHTQLKKTKQSKIPLDV